MELFRVGGDVPDTNYLFMGTRLDWIASNWWLTLLQEILLTADFTPLNLSSYFFASKYDTQIA